MKDELRALRDELARTRAELKDLKSRLSGTNSGSAGAPAAEAQPEVRDTSSSAANPFGQGADPRPVEKGDPRGVNAFGSRKAHSDIAEFDEPQEHEAAPLDEETRAGKALWRQLSRDGFVGRLDAQDCVRGGTGHALVPALPQAEANAGRGPEDHWPPLPRIGSSEIRPGADDAEADSVGQIPGDAAREGDSCEDDFRGNVPEKAMIGSAESL